MSLIVQTEPGIEPVTIAEARNWLRLESRDDDSLIESLVTSARKEVENEMRRTFLNTVYLLTLPRFQDPIRLVGPPIQSIGSVKYWDTGSPSVQQTVSPSVYSLDTRELPGFLHLAPDQTWPSDVSDRWDAVEVTYTAGYGSLAADVPSDIKTAILMQLALQYRYRRPTEDLRAGGRVAQVDRAYRALIMRNKVVHLA